MDGICTGLNILELGSGSAAAAIAGVVFADAGARVVKIEPPDGDRLRRDNPNGFLVWNRGKDSLVADLRTPEGQDRLRELVRSADVVIEGFAPGTTDAWGIGPEALRALNPALIHCSITGFGKKGPYARLKAYDSLVAAKVGLWARGSFGHRDGPIMYPVSWASYGAGMQSAAGILGALIVRDKTGRGQQLDATLVAGLDPIDYFVSTIVQLMAKKGEATSGDARSLTGASRFGVLVASRDGRFIQTSTMLPHQGRALCEVAGIGDVIEADSRFQGLPNFANAEDAQEWEDLLLEAFRAKDFDHWLPLLEASPDIAFEVAVTSEEGLDHPQIVHNGDVIVVQDPTLGPVREVGPIGHFEKTPMVIERSAPDLGANAGDLVAHGFPDGGEEPPAHPFAGITVVEFGYFYAMPYGTAMLAALGARVIKIEDKAGDPHRNSFGPEVATKTTAGKESISLDLRTAEGKAIAREIVAKADAFLTGFRSEVAERMGLGYEELKEINPRLLYVHAAGYGTDGPYAHRALYAQAAQSVAGSFGRQVGYWTDPAQSDGFSVLELQAVVLPHLGQLVDGDSNAALGVLATLALGLYHQHRTGQGQFVGTSMIGGNAWAYSDDFCSYADKPPTPLCDSEFYGVSALDRVYEAADGSWVSLAVKSDAEFTALLDAVGLPELAADERFATATARADHDDDLVALLGGRFAEKPAAEWESELTDGGVGCVNVNLLGQPVFTSFDPVLRETGLTVTTDHPVYGEIVRAAPPISFSETPGRVAPPCVRGQHNESILAELGYSEADIAKFTELNVVTAPG